MARKAAHLTMKPGRSSGRQATWEAIRKLKDRWTLDDLWHETKQPRDTVRTYLTSLIRGGYVVEVGTRAVPNGIIGSRHKAPVPAKTYSLKHDVGLEAPRLRRDGTACEQSLAQEAMWRSMKRMDDFTFADLAIFASTEEVPVSPQSARHYIKHLLKAGYLVVTKPAKPPTHAARYRFIPSRNTGPLAPMIQRLKTVFDPNLRAIQFQEDAGE